jgi:enoyl-CoA hydratase
MVEPTDAKQAPVRLEWRGERIAVVTIDRPARRNAVNHEALVMLAAIQKDVTARARVMVLTGAPPAFCAGADLTGVEDDEFAGALAAALRGFTTMPCLTLAAIDGPALGAGTQLAAACDLRMATPDSQFGIPAAKLGLAVDQWTIERLGREFGWSVARHMLVGVGLYRASQLHVQGSVQRLGGLEDALVWADELAAYAPITIAAHKRGLEAAAGAPADDEQFEALRASAWSSSDADEGRTAFLEKRRPQFRGE